MKISKNRIFIKIFKVLFLAIISFSTIFFVYSLSNQKNEILDSLKLEANSIAKMLVFITSDSIVLDEGSNIIETYHAFLNENSSIKAIVLSKNDDSYYVIKKDFWSYEEKTDDNIKKFEKEKVYSSIEYSSILEENVLHYSYPIIFTQTNWGWLHLKISLDNYKKKINAMYLDFVTIFIVLMLITMFVSYFIAKNLSKPIVSLNKIANKIARGHLELRSNVKTDDEIGELSNSFNKMISKIHLSQKELTNSYEQLEERVKDRTLELYEANKELENNKNELEILNKSLDEKVKDEVEKRTKQEGLLVQQSRLAAMGEMLANIAHQWRQPLSIVTTAASGIKVEKEIGISSVETELERLDLIVNTSNYLSNTIEDFSNFFKPNKEKIEFDIEDKIEQAIGLVNASLKFYHISVERDFKVSKKVYGYPNECAQALLNILTNAKDALVEREVEKPTLKIRVYDEEKYDIIEIEDNAGGISQDIIDRIFDPYFTTKHKTQGTGIGLYMTKMIIEENMQGKLTVSNGEQGAIFKMELPIVKSDETLN